MSANLTRKKKRKHWDAYSIMHGNEEVASIRRDGTCTIYSSEIMPYNLYLEEECENDIDIRILLTIFITGVPPGY